MSVNLLFGKEARLPLLEGASKLNKAVSATLGPTGRNCLFRHMGMVVSTKDGVTVAREVNLKDPFESIGADLCKAAAGQTVDQAGDGTTTAVLLTHAIFEAGCKMVDAENNPVEATLLVRGLEHAVREVVGEYDATTKRFSGGILEKFAIPTTPELAFKTARISANGDDAIAKVVSEAVLRCGVDGALTIGESFSQDHVLEVVDGMQIKSGYVHPYLVNDQQRDRCAMDNVTVGIINRRISTQKEAFKIIEGALKAAESKQRPGNILLICDDIDPEALQLVLKNVLRPPGHKDGPAIPIVVIRAPDWADDRRKILDDLALVTRGRRLEFKTGSEWERLVPSDFGFATRVVVDRSKTIISAEPFSDFEREKTFNPHLAQIKSVIDDVSLRPDEIDRAKTRMANLTGGVAVIKVGGTSSSDVTSTKFRVEDAIHATRGAVSEGVVPGGGSALLFAREALAKKGSPKGLEDGYDLLYSVLARPMEQIARNAGVDPADVVSGVIAKSGNRRGFDAATRTFHQDMIAKGIVDPLRVVRSALNSAASHAGSILLRTEVLIAEEPAAERRQ